MTSEELDQKLKDDRRYRHDQNERISTIIDEMRIGQNEDRQRIKSLELAIEQMTRSIDKLVDAISGTLGFDGIVKTQRRHSTEIQALKDWRRDVIAWGAGLMFSGGFFGAGCTWLLNYFLK